MRATSVPVDPATLALLPQACMSDAYRLVVSEEALDAPAAVNRVFGRFPWWIRALMAMRNRLVAPLGLKTGREKAKTTSRRIGFFPIIIETPERVVLGLDEDEVEAVFALLNPLLRALEMLIFVSRHLHPPDFEGLMSSIGAPDEDLKSAKAKQSEWPEHLSGIRAAIDGVSDAALLASTAFAKHFGSLVSNGAQC